VTQSGPASRGIIITLVHGTWGRNSAFIRPKSLLRDSLRRALDDSIGFLRFGWSGANTHRARISAGRQLAAFLKQAFAKYPDFDHFVISHSHGGNVLLYALRDPVVQAKLRGGVCVATPFLKCLDRFTNNFGLNCLLGSLPFLLVIVPIFVAACFFYFEQYLLAFLMPALALVVTFYGGKSCLEFLGGSAERFKARLNELAFPSDLKVPLLIMRISTDEPGILLRWLSALAFSPTRIFFRLGETVLPLWIAGAVYGLILIAEVAVVPAKLFGWNLALSICIWSLGSALTLTGIAIIGALLWIVFGWAMGKVLTAHPLGFGLDGWHDGWFMDVQVLVEPEYYSLCDIKPYRPAEIREDLGVFSFGISLKHSALFRSRVALSEIAVFIRTHRTPGRLSTGA
jgi:hypothetical protein